jgi:hypothetical protein
MPRRPTSVHSPSSTPSPIGREHQTYHNPLGTNEATAITDNEAFNTCNDASDPVRML